MLTISDEIERLVSLRAIRNALLRLKWLAAATRFEIAMARHDRALKLAYKAGFNPDQPRVPKGNPDGGQWSGAGGGGSGSGGGASSSSGGTTEPTAGSGRNDPRVLSDATPDNYYKPGAQLAQNDAKKTAPAELTEEEAKGGHAIAEHVGKSYDYLLARVRREASEAQQRGFTDGLRVGSFTSLEAANKLVNSTIAANSAKIDLVVSGVSPAEILRKDFSSPTGYEAYARTERSQPYIRMTTGVAVVIVRDSLSAKGYRVQSAFPTNN
jgi:hypothetical protein